MVSPLYVGLNKSGRLFAMKRKNIFLISKELKCNMVEIALFRLLKSEQ